MGRQRHYTFFVLCCILNKEVFNGRGALLAANNFDGGVRMEQAVKRSSNYLYFVCAFLTYLVFHHTAHFVAATRLGVFHDLIVTPICIKVVLTPGASFAGWRLALYSGLGSIVTVSVGYLLFFLRHKILRLRRRVMKRYLYFLTLTFLLVDPMYIAVLSFVFCGDICGIAAGLGITCAFVRVLYGAVGLLNIYLVCSRLQPAYAGDNCRFLSMILHR